MLHLLLLVIFSGAVGAVLGAMLRRDPREAALLALWIAAGMTIAAALAGWLLAWLSA